MERKFSKYTESGRSESLKHKLGQSKGPVCYLCLAGSVVTFWSLKQDVVDSNDPFIQHFGTEISENIQGKFN